MTDSTARSRRYRAKKAGYEGKDPPYGRVGIDINWGDLSEEQRQEVIAWAEGVWQRQADIREHGFVSDFKE